MVDNSIGPDKKLETVKILCAGTGHHVPDNASHIASFKQDMFIWHIYLLP
jgi:hypothetical protein